MAAKKSKTAKSGAGGPHRTSQKKRASPATKKKRPAAVRDKISPETNGLAAGTQAHQELSGVLGGLLAIYDGMFDGLLIADRQTQEILQANSTICRMLGYAEDELAGMSIKDIHPSDALPQVLETFETLVEGQDRLDQRVPFRRKDGSVFYADVGASGGPVEYDGRPCAIGVIRDVTDRIRAEEALRESEQRSRSLLDSSCDSIVLIDRSGTIINLNEAAAQRLNGTVPQLIGRSAYEFFAPAVVERRKAQAEEVVRAGRTLRFEEERDGLLLESMIGPVFDREGNVTELAVCARDITERRRAEEALRESEEMYRKLVEASPDAVTALDLEGHVTYASRRTAELHGYQRAEELLGKSILDLICPEYHQKAATAIQTALKEGVVRSVEGDLLRKDGTSFAGEVSAALVTGAAGEPKGLIGTSRDVTDRRQAEQALRESEEMHRGLVEASPDAVIVTDLQGRITHVAGRTRELFGLERAEDLLGRVGLQLVAPEDHQKATADLQETLEKELLERAEYTLLREDGTRIIAEVNGCLIRDSRGKPTALLTTTRDVTERKRAEQVRRESQERYQALFEQAADSIVLIDGETGALVEFNDRAHDNLGYSREEFERLKIPDFEVIESPEEVAGRIRKIVEQGSDSFETKHRTKGDEIRDVLVSSRAISVGGKDFVQSIWRDITERKRADQALRESQERYQAIFEQAADSIVLVDASGRLVEFNASTYEKLGYTREEFERLKVSDFEVFESAEDVARHIERIVKEGPDTFETKHRTKDGEIRNIQVSTRAISIGGKDFVQGIWRDVTQRKRAEEALKKAHDELERRVEERTAELLMANRQLKQEMEDRKRAQEALRESERLAATGRLAARVAHEINNPLAGIMSSFQLVKQAVPKDHRHYEFAELIEKEIARIGGIVRQMFELYRPDQEKIREVPVAETIDEVVAMLEPSCRDHGVHVEIHVDCPAAIVRTPEGSLRQVLYNLLANAAEASPRGGVIEVAVAAIEDERAVQITVSDQGPGIPEDVQEHVFEPFFTTKSSDASGGIGLGLSISRGIVDSLHGSLDFKTEPGKGTSFRLVLPSV